MKLFEESQGSADQSGTAQVRAVSVDKPKSFVEACMESIGRPLTTPGHTDRLFWRSSNLSIDKVRFNSTIRDLMDQDSNAHNWIYSAVAVFLVADRLELDIPVPDSYRDVLGEVVTLHRFENLGLRSLVNGRHTLPDIDGSDIHILINSNRS